MTFLRMLCLPNAYSSVASAYTNDDEPAVLLIRTCYAACSVGQTEATQEVIASV